MTGRPVLAQTTKIAKSSSPNNISEPLPGVTTMSGTGATAAFGIGGGNAAGVGATRDPAMGGAPFDDTVPYGMTTALTRIQTEIIGQRLLRVYPTLPAGQPLAAGESIRYSVSGPTDKVGPALKQQIPVSIESHAFASTANVSALADGTITSTPNAANKMTAVDISGGAMAVVGNNPFNPAAGQGPGFAVGIVKDPITYTLTSPGTTATIYDTIGSASNPFSLQASLPGSFATGFYDFGTTQTGLLASFSIGIDSQTSSIGQVDFNVGTINPILGFASNADFEKYFLSYLTFDPSNQSLSASTGIPLFQVQLSDANPSATLWYTDGSIAGVVPEPKSLVLLGLGLVVLLVTRLTFHARRQQPDLHVTAR
jgi:hypothetical protein